jgi:hypothetical protein
MKNKLLKKALIIIVILFINAINAQVKNKKTELDSKVLKDTLVTLKIDSILVSQIKNELYEDYKKSNNFAQKELAKESKKQILDVGWYDSKFNKIKETVKDELISIVVLTGGYKIGDKVEVSIGNDEDENSESLLEKEKCHMITFIGNVTHENLAVLQNIFTVEGEKEYIVIKSEWLNRYKCK